MEFGLFTEFQCPAGMSEATAFEESMAQMRAAWRAAGRHGRGDVALLVPVYVAATARQAREEPETSTMHWFRSIAEALKQSPTRRPEAERLAVVPYDEILAEQAVYGTPEAVAERLRELREELGFSSLSAWMNVGPDPARARAHLDAPLHGARGAAPRLASPPFLPFRVRYPFPEWTITRLSPLLIEPDVIVGIPKGPLPTARLRNQHSPEWVRSPLREYRAG